MKPSQLMSKKVVTALKIASIIGIIVWIYSKFDTAKAGETLSAAHLGWAVAAIAGFVIGNICYAYRWALIARSIWPNLPLPFFNFFLYNLLAGFYGLFLPTFISGEAVRIYKLGQHTCKDYVRVTFTALIDRLIGFIIWALIFMFSPSPIQIGRHFLIWIAFVVIIAVLFYFFRNKIKPAAKGLFDTYRASPLNMLKAVAISFVGQITYVFVNFAVFKCFGIHISLLNSCGLASLAIIAGIIPISWLGIGVREGIYIALLPRFGASMAQILFVISFLLAVNYLLCVLGGLIELARTGWNISSLKKISPQ